MTLDAGALIAVERDEREVAAGIEAAYRRGDPAVIPAVALAQAWRGPTSARIDLLARHARIEPFTEERARAVGELLARSGTSDVVDAAVALSAASRGGVLLTSHPDDMRRLAAYLRGSFSIVAV